MIEKEENFQASQIGGFLGDSFQSKCNAFNHEGPVPSEFGRLMGPSNKRPCHLPGT